MIEYIFYQNKFYQNEPMFGGSSSSGDIHGTYRRQVTHAPLKSISSLFKSGRGEDIISAISYVVLRSNFNRESNLDISEITVFSLIKTFLLNSRIYPFSNDDFVITKIESKVVPYLQKVYQETIERLKILLKNYYNFIKKEQQFFEVINVVYRHEWVEMNYDDTKMEEHVQEINKIK